jgi:sugar O-acyltransferase (sialic acid O-acetyltransferase NeuD family)
MENQKVVIIGAGGFGREALDVFDASNQDKQKYEVLGFVVQKEYGEPGTVINNRPILGGFDWLEKHSSQVAAICAVGNPYHRRRLIQMAADLKVGFCSVIHPLAYLSRWVTIGAGTIITAGCIFTTQIKIGNHVHVNLDCTVGHDVVFQDYATVAPGVHISGNVTLEEGCYIGTGANLIEKINIGAWSIVGAGSTITKTVPANTTVVGVPGKIIKERSAGWHLL